MGWLLETIWELILDLLDFLDGKDDPIKQEINAKPKDGVL
jgi:hypothetical protein